MPAVELFQILCFSGMLYPIHAINLNILQAQGRSDLFFKVEIWKKSIGIGILIITLPFGLKTLLWGQVISSFVALYINTWYTQKLYEYGLFKQGQRHHFVFTDCNFNLFRIISSYQFKRLQLVQVNIRRIFIYNIIYCNNMDVQVKRIKTNHRFIIFIFK